MPLVFGAIAPHGGDAIAEIADDPAVMAVTRSGLEEMARRCAATAPETLVVLNPHGVVVPDAISLGAASEAFGRLDGRSGNAVELRLGVDMDFANDLFAEAERDAIPIQRIAQVAEGDESGQEFLWLDWGSLVPLHFIMRALEDKPADVVLIAPNRRLPRQTLVQLGSAIARVAQGSPKRIGLIASCDQGHAHDPNGPYGYSPASAEHDLAMCDAIRDNDLARLLDWPESFLETAKVDAFWQTIILLGALNVTPMHGELLSYEAPTYFGMAVASYLPRFGSDSKPKTFP